MIETYSIDKCPRKFTAPNDMYTGYGHVVTWTRTYRDGHKCTLHFLAFTDNQLAHIKRANDELFARYGEWETFEHEDGQWRIYYGTDNSRELIEWSSPITIGNMQVYFLMNTWDLNW